MFYVKIANIILPPSKQSVLGTTNNYNAKLFNNRMYLKLFFYVFNFIFNLLNVSNVKTYLNFKYLHVFELNYT